MILFKLFRGKNRMLKYRSQHISSLSSSLSLSFSLSFSQRETLVTQMYIKFSVMHSQDKSLSLLFLSLSLALLSLSAKLTTTLFDSTLMFFFHNTRASALVLGQVFLSNDTFKTMSFDLSHQFQFYLTIYSSWQRRSFVLVFSIYWSRCIPSFSGICQSSIFPHFELGRFYLHLRVICHFFGILTFSHNLVAQRNGQKSEVQAKTWGSLLCAMCHCPPSISA